GGLHQSSALEHRSPLRPRPPHREGAGHLQRGEWPLRAPVEVAAARRRRRRERSRNVEQVADAAREVLERPDPVSALVAQQGEGNGPRRLPRRGDFRLPKAAKKPPFPIYSLNRSVIGFVLLSRLQSLARLRGN